MDNDQENNGYQNLSNSFFQIDSNMNGNAFYGCDLSLQNGNFGNPQFDSNTNENAYQYPYQSSTSGNHNFTPAPEQNGATTDGSRKSIYSNMYGNAFGRWYFSLQNGSIDNPQFDSNTNGNAYQYPCQSWIPGNHNFRPVPEQNGATTDDSRKSVDYSQFASNMRGNASDGLGLSLRPNDELAACCDRKDSRKSTTGGKITGSTQKEDFARAYCTSIPNNKNGFICNFCNSEIKSGGITRLKYHLVGDPNKNIGTCEKVTEEAKAKVQEWLRNRAEKKKRKSHITSDLSCNFHPPVGETFRSVKNLLSEEHAKGSLLWKHVAKALEEPAVEDLTVQLPNAEELEKRRKAKVKKRKSELMALAGLEVQPIDVVTNPPAKKSKSSKGKRGWETILDESRKDAVKKMKMATWAKELLKEVQHERDKKNKRIQEVKDKQKKAEEKVQRLEGTLGYLNAELKTINRQVLTLTSEKEDLQKEQAKVRADLEVEKLAKANVIAKLKEIRVEMYMYKLFIEYRDKKHGNWNFNDFIMEYEADPKVQAELAMRLAKD